MTTVHLWRFFGLAGAILLPALGLSGCKDAARTIASKFLFCDELRTKVSSAGSQSSPIMSEIAKPSDILTCMHPTGTFRRAESTLSVVSCEDAQSWHLAQSTRMAWDGLLVKGYETEVKLEFRAAGGYVSYRSSKVMDRAIIESARECTRGEWVTSDKRFDSADEEELLRLVLK